jgi:hypothetical protein
MERWRTMEKLLHAPETGLSSRNGVFEVSTGVTLLSGSKRLRSDICFRSLTH